MTALAVANLRAGLARKPLPRRARSTAAAPAPPPRPTGGSADTTEPPAVVRAVLHQDWRFVDAAAPRCGGVETAR